jgi:hypothetical protein
MSLLNIVSSGYRATVEKQDDTVVWISHAMKNAGAEVDLLLRGAASNYPVKGQSMAPVAFGGRVQKHVPDVLGQIRQLVEGGARVFAVREDLDERGIDEGRLIDGITVVRSDELPGLLSGYDRVWYW